MAVTLIDALNSLGISAYCKNNDYDTIVWTDPKKTVSKADLESKVVELQNAEDAIQYQKDRAVSYDPIPEQLDQIFHDMDGRKARIKSVKDKYPKP